MWNQGQIWGQNWARVVDIYGRGPLSTDEYGSCGSDLGLTGTNMASRHLLSSPLPTHTANFSRESTLYVVLFSLEIHGQISVYNSKQWTDDGSKWPGWYPYRKYMVCVVLNIIRWTQVEMSQLGTNTRKGTIELSANGLLEGWLINIWNIFTIAAQCSHRPVIRIYSHRPVIQPLEMRLIDSPKMTLL